MNDTGKIFLSGATGMVGTSILTYLLQKYPSISIRACYQQSTPFIKDNRIEYIRANLMSADEARRAVSGCNLAIMAAAANTGGAVTLTSHPWPQISDNTVMYLRILEALHFAQVERVVWVGSATLYQEFDGFIKESDLNLNQDPHFSHYGIGWVMRYAEKLCQFWRDNQKMQIINVRSANIFGPYARFDPSRSNFIPAIIRKAVDRMDPLEVWGSPDVTRDVIFSEDFARAIVLLLMEDNIKSGIFNIGSGERTTVQDVVSWALKYSGHSPQEIRYLNDKPTTIRFRALDCTQISNATGWHPKYSVEEGVHITTDWWIKNKDRWTK
jgi:GDP-L-fucose synthase